MLGGRAAGDGSMHLSILRWGQGWGRWVGSLATQKCNAGGGVPAPAGVWGGNPWRLFIGNFKSRLRYLKKVHKKICFGILVARCLFIRMQNGMAAHWWRHIRLIAEM